MSDYNTPPPYEEVRKAVVSRQWSESDRTKPHRDLFFRLHRVYFDFSMKGMPDHDIGSGLGIDVRLPQAVMDEIRAIDHVLRTEYGECSGMRFCAEQSGLYLTMRLHTECSDLVASFYVQQPQRTMFSSAYKVRGYGRAPKIKYLRACLRAALLFAARARAEEKP